VPPRQRLLYCATQQSKAKRTLSALHQEAAAFQIGWSHGESAPPGTPKTVPVSHEREMGVLLRIGHENMGLHPPSNASAVSRAGWRTGGHLSGHEIPRSCCVRLLLGDLLVPSRPKACIVAVGQLVRHDVASGRRSGDDRILEGAEPADALSDLYRSPADQLTTCHARRGLGKRRWFARSRHCSHRPTLRHILLADALKSVHAIGRARTASDQPP